MRGRLKAITPKFVEFIPTEGKDLIPGIVYINMKHGMVVYRCLCGCGGLSEFMLDPIRFRMEYDGSNVTFYPSIGISYLECRSHYWIRNNRIEWCAPMEDWESQEAQRLLSRVNHICQFSVNQFCRFTSSAWPRCWAASVR